MTFVILWLGLFQYESLRYFFLNSWFERPLPKTKLLFPPAGWIMFYQVGKGFGHIEVYGVKEGRTLRIDPHDIIRTRTIMFDNIHRNILSSMADQRAGPRFCAFLRRRFESFDQFHVAVHYYPDPVERPFDVIQQIKYTCTDR